MPTIADIAVASADKTPDSFLHVPQLLPGLRSAADQYRGFIVDLWGVVHDGQAPFPHSAEALAHLHQKGRKIALLSNAPRRSRILVEQLEKFGIPASSYSFVLSSGDAVRTALIERTDPAFAALGETCHHLGPERDLSLFDDVPVRRVALEHADFIVNTGPLHFTDPPDRYQSLLQAARDRSLPMVCANPDRVAVRQGKSVACAGAIADLYAALGGTVLWRGKPDPEIYHLCAKMMDCPESRIAVIGDSLETDMRGAQRAGINSIWVTGGIHAKELDAAYGKPADPLRLARLAAAADLAPTAVIPGFIW